MHCKKNLLAFMPLLVKLDGIYDVLPYAVQSSCDGSHRSQIRIAEPYQEAGVFLSKCLSGGDFIRRPFFFRLLPSDSSCRLSDTELDDRTSQRNDTYQHYYPERYMAEYQCSGGKKNRQCQRNAPEIASPFSVPHQPALESPGSISD